MPQISISIDAKTGAVKYNGTIGADTTKTCAQVGEAIHSALGDVDATTAVAIPQHITSQSNATPRIRIGG